LEPGREKDINPGTTGTYPSDKKQSDSYRGDKRQSNRLSQTKMAARIAAIFVL
jgi:hypothetical protein